MDQSDIKPTSLIVGNCRSCSGLVRIPAAAKTNSIVRCPHCGQSFSLLQILENSIPELEILEPEIQEKQSKVIYVDRALHKENDAEQPREKFVVPRQLTIGAKRKRRNRRRNSAADAKENGSPLRDSQSEPENPPDLAIDEPAAAETTSNWEFDGINFDRGQPASVRSSVRGISTSDSRARLGRREAANSGRMKRPAGSDRAPIFEILKIVLGGALAFPIAYLILFWIFRQDPLHLGPNIENFVPFVVPTELRAKPSETSEKDDEETDNPIEAKIPKSIKNGREKDIRNDDLPIPDVDPDKVHLGESQTN